jgi:hypothetical protein
MNDVLIQPHAAKDGHRRRADWHDNDRVRRLLDCLGNGGDVCSDSAWAISLSFDGAQVDTTSNRRWRSAKSTGRS